MNCVINRNNILYVCNNVTSSWYHALMCIEEYNHCIYIMHTSILLNKSIKYVKYVEQILCNMKIEMYCLIRNYCNMDKWIVHILYILENYVMIQVHIENKVYNC